MEGYILVRKDYKLPDGTPIKESNNIFIAPGKEFYIKKSLREIFDDSYWYYMRGLEGTPPVIFKVDFTVANDRKNGKECSFKIVEVVSPSELIDVYPLFYSENDRYLLTSIFSSIEFCAENMNKIIDKIISEKITGSALGRLVGFLLDYKKITKENLLKLFKVKNIFSCDDILVILKNNSNIIDSEIIREIALYLYDNKKGEHAFNIIEKLVNDYSHLLDINIINQLILFAEEKGINLLIKNNLISLQIITEYLKKDVFEYEVGQEICSTIVKEKLDEITEELFYIIMKTTEDLSVVDKLIINGKYLTEEKIINLRNDLIKSLEEYYEVAVLKKIFAIEKSLIMFKINQQSQETELPNIILEDEYFKVICSYLKDDRYSVKKEALTEIYKSRFTNREIAFYDQEFPPCCTRKIKLCELVKSSIKN